MLFPNEAHNFAPRPQLAAEDAQFPDAEIDDLVLQLPRVDALFLIAHGVFDGLCQAFASVALVHHGDDLLFHQTPLAGVFVGAVAQYRVL